MTDLSTKPPALGRHLDEEERQGLADDTLPEARRVDADAHVAHCPSCAEDVNRLRLLVMRTRAHLTSQDARPEEEETVEALWPSIRARIESAKVVRLAGESLAAPTRQGRWTARSRRVATWLSVGLAAAIVAAMLVKRSTLSDMSTPRAGAISTSDTAPIFAVDDSATAYQREVETMLEELELQRAMLKPEVAASLDHDLRAIDRAIAELRDALKRDPNNPALRQLLAASYRQKRDLLERIANAS
ncbi:MAG: hypothetical protein ACJ796_16600 [Gemmatimonadaceae bacterium]